MASNNDNEAPPAILTKTQRERLEGDTAPENEDARWRMHSRIRKRLRQAIYDFTLIYNNWGELNLDKVFDETELNRVATEDGISRAVSTLYRGLYGGNITFEPLLKDGIFRAESDMNNRYVDVRFGVEHYDSVDVNTNDAIERVTPESVGSLRIPEMRAVLDELANCDIDIPEMLEEERNKPLGDDETAEE